MALKNLYRFQGLASFKSIDLSEREINLVKDNNYVYISKSYDHHAYFTYKRMRKLLQELSRTELDVNFSNALLRDTRYYHKMQEIVANSDKVINMESLSFKVVPSFIELLDKNSCYSEKKEKNNSLERVDRKVFGGGYGLSKEWLELLNYLTLVYSVKDISRNNLLVLLRRIREGMYSIPEIPVFLNEGRSEYINNVTLSPFNKYEIRRAMENIYDAGAYNEDSEFGKHPTLTIKKVCNEYLDARYELFNK